MMKNIERLKPPHSNHDRHDDSAFRFIIFCVVLAAMIFGLIHTVIYFTEPRGAAAGHAAESLPPTSDKAFLVHP